jgi:hypothetical protein
LTDKILYVAGVPDVADTRDAWGAIEGRKGGRLLAMSTADGRTLSSMKLDSPPVDDGLAAARGRLFMCTRDGMVRCFR